MLMLKQDLYAAAYLQGVLYPAPPQTSDTGEHQTALLHCSICLRCYLHSRCLDLQEAVRGCPTKSI